MPSPKTYESGLSDALKRIAKLEEQVEILEKDWEDRYLRAGGKINEIIEQVNHLTDTVHQHDKRRSGMVDEVFRLF